MVNWVSTVVPVPFSEEQIVFSANGFGRTGYPYAKEWSSTFTLHHTQKLTHSASDLNVRVKTIKLLEENKREKFYDIGLGTDFLSMTPKTQEKNW